MKTLWIVVFVVRTFRIPKYLKAKMWIKSVLSILEKEYTKAIDFYLFYQVVIVGTKSYDAEKFIFKEYLNLK